MMEGRRTPKIAALGAASAPELAAAARDAARLAAGAGDEAAFAEIVAALGRDVSNEPCRVAVATVGPVELAGQLEAAAAFLETGKGKRQLGGRGVFVGAPDQPPRDAEGKVAMLFPGQGAQSVGMLAELAAAFDVVREVFDEADATLGPALGRPLTDYVFGRGQTPEEAQQALTRTAITQPAILACDLALLKLLEAHGVAPDMAAGHSLGEYAACVAASVMSAGDALRAVAERGRAMTEATPPGTDPGWMAAVGAPLDQVLPLLARVDGYVIPANKNCSAQTIIAGASGAVERAMALFDEAGLQTVRLPVSHAFHTSIVEPASEALERFLRGLGLSPPTIPLLANVTGAEYPVGPGAPADAVKLLARQVASPVEFIAEIERLYELGARTFVEVGPRRTLTTFVGDILGKRPHLAVATNNPRKGDVASFCEALAAIVAGGGPAARRVRLGVFGS